MSHILNTSGLIIDAFLDLSQEMLMGGAPQFIADLLEIQGQDDQGDVLIGSRKTLVLVDPADLGFNSGGIPQGSEKVVGGEVGEELSPQRLGDDTVIEQPFSSIKTENSISKPSLFLQELWIKGRCRGHEG